MAGERRARVTVSVEPLVKNSDDDADDTYTWLHDIKQSLGGISVVDSNNSNDKWYYAPNIIVTTETERVIGSSGDRTKYVGASGNPDDHNEPVDSIPLFTDGGAIDVGSDHFLWIYIKNTGTSDINGTPTTNSFAYNFDSNPNIVQTHKWYELRPGEAMAMRHGGGYDLDTFCGGSVTEGMADDGAVVNGSSSVRVTVLALIDS